MENTGRPLEQVPAASPALAIGTQDGAPESLFGHIAGALALSDGRIVIADAGQHDVRFFDQGGRMLRRVGRRGSGPGEYEAVEILRAPGDTVLVWDFIQRRVSVLDRDGTLARTVPVTYGDSLSPAGYWFLGRMDDGSLLLRSLPNPAPPVTGARRDSLRLVSVTEGGRLLRDWGWFPGDERVQVATGRGVSGYPRPFGREARFLPAGKTLLFASGDTYEVRAYADGQLRTLIRKRQAPVPVTAADILDFKQHWVASVDPAARPRLERVADAIPFPRAMPAHGRLISAGETGFWVQHYSHSASAPETWDRFDPEGRLAGTITLPPGFRATQAGPGFVLGVGTDSLGVERVMMYRLPRS